MFLALAAPIVAHGIYDSVLFSMTVVSSPVVAVVLAVVFIVFCVKLWKRGSRSIHEHLRRDVDSALLDKQ